MHKSVPVPELNPKVILGIMKCEISGEMFIKQFVQSRFAPTERKKNGIEKRVGGKFYES